MELRMYSPLLPTNNKFYHSINLYNPWKNTGSYYSYICGEVNIGTCQRESDRLLKLEMRRI